MTVLSGRRKRICAHKWTPWARIGQRPAWSCECLKCGTVSIDADPTHEIMHAIDDAYRTDTL